MQADPMMRILAFSLGYTIHGSVNSTIVVGDFPSVMSSMDNFITTIWRVSKGARVINKDLVSAYKHQRVHADYLKLQVVESGGRCFVELVLMFWARSSPGIFCKLLALFVSCVALLSGITPHQYLQHLDDLVGKNKT